RFAERTARADDRQGPAPLRRNPRLVPRRRRGAPVRLSGTVRPVRLVADGHTRPSARSRYGPRACARVTAPPPASHTIPPPPPLPRLAVRATRVLAAAVRGSPVVVRTGRAPALFRLPPGDGPPQPSGGVARPRSSLGPLAPANAAASRRRSAAPELCRLPGG